MKNELGPGGGVLGRLEELRVLVARLHEEAASPQGLRRLREAQALLHAVEDAVRGALRAEATWAQTGVTTVPVVPLDGSADRSAPIPA